MARDGFISIVNLDSFQHYKDRNPPWIKLHTALLEKYEYQRLQDASKAHLTGLWMLASRLDNRIPNDPEWIAQRIGATSIVNLQPLLDAGFIELVESRTSKPLALGLQVACPETETETETETFPPPTGAADTIRDGLRPEYRPAFEGICRAAQNPGALSASILALAPGGIHAAGTWEEIGRTLMDVAAAGGRVTPRTLRTFLKRIQDDDAHGVGHIPNGGRETQQERNLRIIRETDKELERNGVA